MPPDAPAPAPAAAADRAKQAAAEGALALFVRPGMRLGLGSGSTAEAFIRLLGRAAPEGVVSAATSERSEEAARQAGLRLAPLDRIAPLDLAVDGADEINPALSAVKGGGGCHLREKIVARAAARFVLIADESKWKPALGGFPLPLELLPFASEAVLDAVADRLGGLRPVLRRDAAGGPVLSDNGNLLADIPAAVLAPPADLAAVARALEGVAGVVEHGLFLHEACAAVLGSPDGSHRLIEREGGAGAAPAP